MLDNDLVPDFLRTVRLITDGSFVYGPAADFQYLGLGDTALVTFECEVEDADGDTARAIATIEVTGTNDAPIANTFFVSATEDTLYSGQVTASVVDNLQSELVFTVFNGPSNGTQLMGTDGTFTYDPGHQPDQIVQEFVLTLPTDRNSDFDQTFTATSQETSNGSRATQTATVPIDYDDASRTSRMQFDATDQSIWSSGDQFSFTDDRFIGFDTGAFSHSFGSSLYAGVSGDIQVGFQSSLSFEGGQIDATANYDVTIETSYNRTTDELLIDTGALLRDTAFSTLGPSGSYSLDFLYDIMMNAYAGVNVDLGGIDFGVFGGIDFGSINSRSDIVGIDTGPQSVSLVDLDSDSLAGEIPFPSPADAFSMNFDWPDLATSGSTTSSGESQNFLELVMDLDDLAFQLATNYPVNPPRAFVGPAYIEYDLLDVDIIGGMNFFQDFALAMNDLTGTLVFEDASTHAFTIGDSLQLGNAALIDQGGNANGVVDFAFYLTPMAELSNDTTLGFNIGVDTSLFEVEVGYIVSIDNPFSDLAGADSYGFCGSTSFGPVAGYAATVPVTDVTVYDDTFALGFGQETLTMFA